MSTPNPVVTDKVFLKMVADDVRGNLTGADKQWLHSEEMLDRRFDGLIALKRDLEVQLATQKARWANKQHELRSTSDDGTEWVAFKAQEYDWRVRAIKFLGEVEDHITLVKAIRKAQREKTPQTRELLDLILEHEQSIEPDEATPADQELWAKARALVS